MEPAVFQKELRLVLNHLYDRDLLRQCTMIDWFGLREKRDAALSLQEIVIQAIEALKPGAGEPNFAEKRKVYDILVYRYIEQFKQVEVAHNIGVSIRQFRREQDAAIEVLMYYLLDQYPFIKNEAYNFARNKTQMDPAMIHQEAALKQDVEGEERVSDSEDYSWILGSRSDWVTHTRGRP